MHLDQVELTRFRSLLSATFRLGDLTGIVGQNSAGKSGLLRALNAFFNLDQELPSHLSGQHLHTPRSHALLDLTFGDLPNDDDIQRHAHEGCLRVRMTLRPNSDRPTIQVRTPGLVTVETDFIEVIRRHVRFVLVPPFRDPSNFRWEEEALLRQTVDAILERHTARRDTLTSRFTAATEFLERRTLKPLAEALKSYYGVNHDLSFDIRFPENSTYRTFLSDIVFRIVEAGTVFDVAQQGTGVQSLTIIALHRLLASLQDSHLVLGIEEPEANLHPQAQRELIGSFRSMITDDERVQLIFTTHSPVMVDQLDHEEVILLKKEVDPERGVLSTVAQLEHSFLQRHGLEEQRYYKFHKYRNSDFFFADLVVVVEGEVDSEAVRQLLIDTGTEPDQRSISILPLNGADNLPYIFHLLGELSIPRLIILDKDHFLPYSGDDLKSSRDGSGFPKYRYEWKPDCLIEHMVPDPTDRETLLELLRTNHSRAMELFGRHGVLCMKYNLETDLIASNTATALFYDRLNVPLARRSRATLLIDYRKAIKRPNNLLAVLRMTPHRNLPHSFRRIKRVVPQLIG